MGRRKEWELERALAWTPVQKVWSHRDMEGREQEGLALPHSSVALTQSPSHPARSPQLENPGTCLPECSTESTNTG